MSLRVGVEFEWLAPKGLSRQTYAQYLATQIGGSIHHFWHPQVEPAKVPGTPLFHNLTQGFAVLDSHGTKLAHTVGDLTIQAQLDRTQPAKPGWNRIVSDDIRLLLLTARHTPAMGELYASLVPIAKMFGTTPQRHDSIVRVEDEYQSSIVLGAPMPGERERVCEVVSGIIDNPTVRDLEMLITPAKKLGFTIPIESATHIHFCARPLQHPRTLKNLIFLLHTYRWVLRDIVQTNDRCIRLGSWPQELFDTIQEPGFIHLSWEQAKKQLVRLPLTKFCDFNIKNLIHEFASKNTFELRILPGLMESKPVMNAILLFSHIFTYVQHHDVLFCEPVPHSSHEEFYTKIGYNPIET